jgi:hypothetical protein
LGRDVGGTQEDGTTEQIDSNPGHTKFREVVEEDSSFGRKFFADVYCNTS